jgi:hypothetical protein
MYKVSVNNNEITNAYASELLEITSLVVYAHCGPS